MKVSKIRLRGFSMVEVVIVVTVVLILGAVAIPNIVTATANVRLRGAASDLSGLMQSARLVAVKNNATYTVLFNPTSTLLGAYVDLNNNGSFDAGEPMIQFGGSVAQVAAPNGSGNSPSALDGGSGPLGWTATSGNLSFNPRGLSCDVTKTPCGTNVGYVFYLSDNRPSGGGWAAVSITAAGRIKAWTWSGSAWIN